MAKGPPGGELSVQLNLIEFSGTIVFLDENILPLRTKTSKPADQKVAGTGSNTSGSWLLGIREREELPPLLSLGSWTDL